MSDNEPVAQIAKAIQVETGGNVEGKLPDWWSEFIGMVLAELQSAGRLVPAGGMALAVEQVEDVRTLVGHGGSDYAEAFNRLRALFPATEPAECEFRCDEGIVRAGVGVRCPACTAAIRDKEAIKPAEEETKAELCSGGGDMHPCVLAAGHAGVHTDSRGLRWNYPASSPDVPAPTETGPWQTWQEVPDDTPFWSRDRRETNSWWWIKRTTEHRKELRQADSCGETVHLGQTSFMNEFAPFVAAEEGS